MKDPISHLRVDGIHFLLLVKIYCLYNCIYLYSVIQCSFSTLYYFIFYIVYTFSGAQWEMYCINNSIG